MINVKQLEAFDAIMRTGSITRAAIRLSRTQPQISRLLASLEQEMGVPLFRRDSKGLTPTAAALDYHLTVSAALEQLNAAISSGRTMARGKAGSLRILASPHLARNIVVDAVAECCRADADFAAEILFQAEDKGQAAAGDWDVAVTISAFGGQGECELIARVAVCAVLPADHPLAARDRLRWADLVGESVILTNSHTEIRKVIDGQMAPASGPPKQRIVVPNSTLACMLAERGVGIAITEAIEASTTAGTATKILSPTIEVPYYLTVREESAGSQGIDLLVSRLKRTVAAKWPCATERTRSLRRRSLAGPARR